MKTALISLFAATLLGFISQLGGHALNESEFIAILFVAGLVGWTFQQYSNTPARLDVDLTTDLPVERPYHLPVGSTVQHLSTHPRRLAA